MRRVLIISYYWPPAGGSGVQRWVKFAKYLPQMGWQPVVYTPSNPSYQTLDKNLGREIPPEAEIIRTPIWEPYGAWKRFDRSGAKELNPIHGGRKTLKQRLSLLIRANLFIPDPRVSWVKPSVKFLARYLRKNPVEAIITTGPPQSMHLIGRRLSIKTGLPWIADFRDPWTDIFYFKHLPLTGAARRKQENLELEVLRDATAVVAVSPAVQKDFALKTMTPVHLITNGFDPEDYAFEAMGDGFFNITHTGQFSLAGIPENLWKAIAELCDEDADFAGKVRIRLCGQTDSEVLESIAEAGLSKKIVNLGYKPHLTAIREQKAAGMLILPLRKDPEYAKVLPGKLFEYLAAGRPILGIGQKNGAMATVLEDTGAGVTCEWDDVQGAKQFISKIWRIWRSGRQYSAPSGIDRYSRRNVTAQYVKLLNSITGK
ncbi:MAG: glycosyltransferase family 4 protein [Bacteroidales bacterium]|nr:glycosyltransferase family 4 protein [Bacteroidales bacterium]